MKLCKLRRQSNKEALEGCPQQGAPGVGQHSLMLRRPRRLVGCPQSLRGGGGRALQGVSSAAFSRLLINAEAPSWHIGCWVSACIPPGGRQRARVVVTASEHPSSAGVIKLVPGHVSTHRMARQPFDRTAPLKVQAEEIGEAPTPWAWAIYRGADRFSSCVPAPSITIVPKL